MKWTTRGRYSVKALLDLALSGSQLPVSVRAIAERQNIPAPYLEKLLIELRQAGLVRSQRGAQGGYRLARSARKISLAEILAAVGERLEPLSVPETEAEESERVEDWVTQAVWQRVSQRLQQVLAEITLEDLYFDARSRQAAQSEAPEFIV
ncbi:RrF2 family transcriptional regulator [Synechococcus sp. PCC 7336]|uniref:Rrf2 family transcriptional regulator n=1 Tax=Synechococcus sp. PCC 7336 TaxID=195250 RepID=UPI00034547D3|nr:RrF2 family transcriptional regulator [Synechococcus sp. PCC 7336]